MTFDRPLWLLLLLALPLLWWLHRRLRAPREVVVASVDALRGARTEESGQRPRRRLDLELLALLLAAGCLALCAAGPRVGTPRPVVLVAVDTSASMGVPGVDGESLGDLAYRAALGRVAAAGAAALVVELDAPQVASRMDPGDAVAAPPFGFAGADDLPASLAPVLARARREGFPGVLVVTDRALATDSQVVVSGPGTAAARTWAIADAVLEGARSARVTVLRGDAGERSLIADRAPGGTITVAVPPGEGPVVVTVPAPPPGGGGTFRLDPPGEGPGASLGVSRVGGVRRVRVFAGERAPPRLSALLTTLGIEVVEGALAEPDVDILVGVSASERTPPRFPAPPFLQFAAAATRDVAIDVRQPGPVPTRISGAAVAASGALSAAVPGPGVTLVTTSGRIQGDNVAGAWTCVDGAIALAFADRVVTTLRPETESSTWHTDPSFPVFVLTALEHLAGGPDRLASADATPLSELVRDDLPPPVADAAAVAGLVRPARDDPASWSAAPLLAALAAGLVLLLVVRDAGRFSGARRPRVAAP